MDLRSTTLSDFVSVLTTARISGGIARVLSDCTQGPEAVLVIPAGTTLSHALDAVAGDARSEWQIIDGVVNLLPAGPVPPLLETRIHSFIWDKNASPTGNIARLAGSPEVMEGARQLGLEQAPYEGGATSVCIRNCAQQPKPEPRLHEERNSSLIELLNRIVQAHTGAVWAYSEYHCGKVTRFRVDTVAE